LTARRPFRLRGPRGLAVPLAGALVLLGSGCTELAEPTVVTIGSQALTARDLREMHAALDAGQRSSLATREERNEFVDRVVERVLLEEHGRELVAAGKASIEEEVAAAREDWLVRRLRTILGSDAPLDSVTARAAYDRMGLLHRVRMVAFPREEEARAARAALAPGEGLDRLPTFSDGHGIETWVAWSPLPDPLADLAAEQSPGEVAGPVLLRSWWRLVEVVDRRPAEQEDFETVRPRILRGLRVRGEAEAARALLDTLRTDSGLRIDASAVSRLAELTREAILRPDATENDVAWAVPSLPADDLSRPVAEWKGGVFTGADYVEVVEGANRGQRPRAACLELAVLGLVQEAVERRLLAAEAERRGLGQDRWVRQAVARDRADRLIRVAVTSFEQGNEPFAASDSLLAILRTSQPQLFRSEARARLLRFDLPTRERAEREVREIRRAGGGPERLRELLEAPWPFPGTYHLLELTRAAFPDSAMARAVFDGPRGVPTGPWEVPGTWAVVVCLAVEPPRDLTPGEIRATMSAGATRPSVVQEWVRLRRTQVGVTVNEDALDELGPGG